MGHSINEKFFFQHFEKEQIIKNIVEYCCRKNYKQRHIHDPPPTSGVQTRFLLIFICRFVRK